MKQHKGIIGIIVYDDEKIIEIIGGENGEGICYKDKWDCGDVIYISEWGIRDFCADNVVKFEDIAWTKENWVDWVDDMLQWDEDINDLEFAEYVARLIYEDVECEDLCTRLSEWINGNDIEDIYKDWLMNK